MKEKFVNPMTFDNFVYKHPERFTTKENGTHEYPCENCGEPISEIRITPMMNLEEFQEASVIEDDEGWKVGEEYLMRKDEKPVIEKCVRELCKELKPDSVLQIGLGPGYSMKEFKKQGVKRQVIIEAHPYFYEKAKEWAKENDIELILGSWQDTELDEKFDLLFNDVYEMMDAIETPEDRFNCREVYNYQVKQQN